MSKTKDMKSLMLNIMAGHFCRNVEEGEKKGLKTPQNKGCCCICCFFVRLGGLRSKVFFCSKKHLVAKKGPLNMDAVRDVMGVWCFFWGVAFWESSAKCRKHCKNRGFAFFGGSHVC